MSSRRKRHKQEVGHSEVDGGSSSSSSGAAASTTATSASSAGNTRSALSTCEAPTCLVRSSAACDLKCDACGKIVHYGSTSYTCCAQCVDCMALCAMCGGASLTGDVYLVPKNSTCLGHRLALSVSVDGGVLFIDPSYSMEDTRPCAKHTLRAQYDGYDPQHMDFDLTDDTHVHFRVQSCEAGARQIHVESGSDGLLVEKWCKVIRPFDGSDTDCVWAPQMLIDALRTGVPPSQPASTVTATEDDFSILEVPPVCGTGPTRVYQRGGTVLPCPGEADAPCEKTPVWGEVRAVFSEFRVCREQELCSQLSSLWRLYVLGSNHGEGKG